MSDVRKHLKLQRFTYAFLRIVFGWAILLFRRVRLKPCRIRSETALVLWNHTDDLDPVYTVIGTKRHARFVGSANLLRGPGGFFLRVFIGMLPRKKGVHSDELNELIRENLKNGVSVSMAAEGNRSWDGQTGYIFPRVIGLVRGTGAGLVTYRFSGGYLRTPRWAKRKRKGPMTGELVREYSPEELDKMTDEEIYDRVKKDLYVNVFDGQKASPVRYPGKDLAEDIEGILYLCPRCKKIGTIRSKGDRFSCSCGLTAECDEYGFFRGEDLPFDETVSWNRWQKNYLSEHYRDYRDSGEPLSEDGPVRVFRIEGRQREMIVKDGVMKLYGKGIGSSDGTFLDFSEIQSVSGFRNRRLFLNTERGYYEAVFDRPVSEQKYEAFWRNATGRPFF